MTVTGSPVTGLENERTFSPGRFPMWPGAILDNVSASVLDSLPGLGSVPEGPRKPARTLRVP